MRTILALILSCVCLSAQTYTNSFKSVVVNSSGQLVFPTNNISATNTVISFASVTEGTQSANSQVVFDGDSLTWFGYPTYTTTTLTFDKYNTGVPGSKVDAMIERAPVNVDVHYSNKGRYNIVVIWGGTNDMFLGDTAEQAFDRLMAYCRDRRAKGWRVIVVTMISRIGFDTQKNTYNALIRSAWPTFADEIVDLGATSELGADGACMSNYWFYPDNIHLSDAGYQLVALHVSTAINRLTDTRYSYELRPRFTDGAYLSTTTQPNAVLEIAGKTQWRDKILFSGQEYYEPYNTSFDGISLRLGINRTGNRQLWIADSARSISATNAQVRIVPGGTYSQIDSISTDATTSMPLILQAGGGGVGINLPWTPAAPLEIPSSTSNSSAKFGSIEFQTYAVNNSWITDNLLYNGGFKYRANGYGTLQYFSVNGYDVRTASTGIAGASATPIIRLAIKNDGDFAIGGSIPGTLDYTGATLIGSSTNIIISGNVQAKGYVVPAGGGISATVDVKTSSNTTNRLVYSGGILISNIVNFYQ